MHAHSLCLVQVGMLIYFLNFTFVNAIYNYCINVCGYNYNYVDTLC